MYFSTTCPSPVGTLTLAAHAGQLVGLWMEGQKYHGDTIPEAMAAKGDVPVFDAARRWLEPSATIPFPPSSPATASWGQTEA